MVKRLKEGDTPLFDMDDKDLIRFAYRTKNQNISDIVNPEMMRRLKISIDEFNRKSSGQTSEMIKLTHWIIGLTILLGVLALIQVILLIQ